MLLASTSRRVFHRQAHGGGTDSGVAYNALRWGHTALMTGILLWESSKDGYNQYVQRRRPHLSPGVVRVSHDTGAVCRTTGSRGRSEILGLSARYGWKPRMHLGSAVQQFDRLPALKHRSPMGRVGVLVPGGLYRDSYIH